MQIISAAFTKTPPFVFKNRDRISNIPEYGQQLLEAYATYYNDLLTYAQEDEKGYNEKKKSFDTKQCLCGSPLRYISSYDFWGCSNYKDQSKKHLTFSGKNPIIYPIKVRVKSTWLPDIISSCGLKGKVFAKELYEFYLSNGLEDLRIKYGRNTTEKTFMGLIKAKGRSIEQEMAGLTFLQSAFSKVVYQQCITYKLKDEKEAFCIPDYIVSDGITVKVIDAKLDYANDDKMDKYIALVKFILNKNNDTRPVTGAHLLYNTRDLEYFKSRHELITIPYL